MRYTTPIFGIVLLSSTFSLTRAQKPHLGLAAGLNISSMHFSPPPSAFSTNVKVSSKAGATLGAVLDVPFSPHVGIETGLIYTMKGLKLSGQQLELRYTYHYLNIPVLFKYQYKGAFVAIGPYVGVIMGAKVKLISVDTNLSEKIPIVSDPDSDGIKRMDWGMNFKGGYQLPAGVEFFMQYSLGIGNVEPALHTTEHHRTFTIGIGYYLKPKHTTSKDPME